MSIPRCSRHRRELRGVVHFWRANLGQISRALKGIFRLHWRHRRCVIQQHFQVGSRTLRRGDRAQVRAILASRRCLGPSDGTLATISVFSVSGIPKSYGNDSATISRGILIPWRKAWLRPSRSREAFRCYWAAKACFTTEYLTAELARPDLDLYLAMPSANNPTSSSPFSAPIIGGRSECNLEWRQLRDILLLSKATVSCPCVSMSTPIPGMLAIDGYVTISGRAPEEVAELILQRLGATGYVGNGPAPRTGVPSGPDPIFWNDPYARGSILHRPQTHLQLFRSRLESVGRAALRAGTGRHGRHRQDANGH